MSHSKHINMFSDTNTLIPVGYFRQIRSTERSYSVTVALAHDVITIYSLEMSLSLMLLIFILGLGF